MNYYLKHLISYIMISIGSVTIFNAFLMSHPEYPGGQVGMAPFLILFNCIIATCIMFILLLLIRLRIKISLFASTSILAITYCLVLIFYFEANPLVKGDEMARNINTWGYLCLLLSYVTFNLVAVIIQKYLSKTHPKKI